MKYFNKEQFTKFTKFTLLNNLVSFARKNDDFMSSNIKINLICVECANDFTAKTTVTKYCSKKCNTRAYKRGKSSEKLLPIIQKTKRIQQKVIENLSLKEFLSVTEVSKLIGCSRQNVYKLINSGKLKATNLLLKKTIVKRVDLDQLFIDIDDRSIINNREDLSKQCDINPLQEISNMYGDSQSGNYEYSFKQLPSN